MADAVVVSGAGPYADPWHDFPATSGRIARIVGNVGYTVRVAEDVEATLAEPGTCRLLVVNVGNPVEPRPIEPMEAAQAGLDAHVRSGGGLLGVHASATSLTTMPRWPAILGGRWVRGRSMHPPKGPAHIIPTPASHPVTNGLADFDVIDERYSYLETEPDVTVLAEHEHDERRHPLVWAYERGHARVVYDGLGHDTDSYDSPGHVELLARTVRWLMHDAEGSRPC